ncbi:hypothetical protein L1049_023569 [Liquidambar formosana]|uniref:Uncharacterized protein n=1 Tax=Liquidambar formosana TaxID=63359 RepID=A0AAP0RUE2_LIQFO
MARFGMVCLILAEILMVQTVLADGSYGSEANPPKVKVQDGVETNEVVADGPVFSPAESPEGKEERGEVAEGPAIRRLAKHHSSDKSVAGGGVIIGGLVTAIFAAVFCYIRVTRKRDGDHH